MKTYEIYPLIIEEGKKIFRRKKDNELYAWNWCFNRFHRVNEPLIWVNPELNEEWEEIKSMGFMEAVASGKNIKADHELIEDDMTSFSNFQSLDRLLRNLDMHFPAWDIKEILLSGNFYIGD